MRLIAAAALALVTLACQSTDYSDIMVEASDADASAFDGRTTYAWGGPVGPILDADSRWMEPHPDVAEDIVEVTDRALAGRGFTKADGADLMVYYGAGVDMTRMPMVRGETSQDTRLDVRTKAGLCILITDAETGGRLWAGVASGDLDWDPTAERTRDRIEHAVRELFDGFPTSSDG